MCGGGSAGSAREGVKEEHLLLFLRWTRYETTRRVTRERAHGRPSPLIAYTPGSRDKKTPKRHSVVKKKKKANCNSANSRSCAPATNKRRVETRGSHAGKENSSRCSVQPRHTRPAGPSRNSDPRAVDPVMTGFCLLYPQQGGGLPAAAMFGSLAASQPFSLFVFFFHLSRVPLPRAGQRVFPYPPRYA